MSACDPLPTSESGVKLTMSNDGLNSEAPISEPCYAQNYAALFGYHAPRS